MGQDIAKNIEVSVKVVAGNSALDYDASFTGETKTIDELLSPVSQIEAGTVRCVGLNYKEHAAEMKLTLPNTPTWVYLLWLLTIADTVQCISKGQHLHFIRIRPHYTSLQRGLRWGRLWSWVGGSYRQTMQECFGGWSSRLCSGICSRQWCDSSQASREDLTVVLRKRNGMPILSMPKMSFTTNLC